MCKKLAVMIFFFKSWWLADRSGMRPGDGILQINNVPATYLDHEQAKMEIIRSGNELDFVVQR
jgi:type II secretory pathway component PulC